LNVEDTVLVIKRVAADGLVFEEGRMVGGGERGDLVVGTVYFDLEDDSWFLEVEGVMHSQQHILLRLPHHSTVSAALIPPAELQVIHFHQ